MTRHFERKQVKAVAAILTVLAGAWAVGAVRERYEVARMTEKPQTVCVGRMLIDLPQSARVALYGARVYGFSIAAFPESAKAFGARLAAREAELRATPDHRGGNKNLELARDVKTGSGLDGKIFVYGRNVSEGDAYNATGEEHYRYEGVALEAHVHGDGISIDLSNDDYDPKRIENLPRLIAQLVPNPGNDIPTTPGFCIDRAYVQEPLHPGQREQVSLLATLPNHSDIEIRFDTMAGAMPGSKGLLTRSAESHARLPALLNLRFTNLRAAPRTIGGLTGDELVERVVEENFSVIFGFRWEVNGPGDNVLVPDVTLRMATGRSDAGPVPSSLSQGAALALWDNISSSVRVRPTVSPAKVTVAEPASAPLGTVALAGQPCPWTGWWLCASDTGARVLGGQRQHIRRGTRMPQALLLARQTLWDKMRGLQSSFEDSAPTSWRLVDKRDRPRRALQLQPAPPTAAMPAASADGRTCQPAPLGSLAATGATCPASGWWCCQEPNALDGARWFPRGALLPTATLPLPPDFIGRSPRGLTVLQRRCIWRLARLAHAPDPASPPA